MASSSDRSFTARFELPETLERAAPCTVRCPIYRDGAVVAPESARVRLVSPSGVDVLDEEATVAEDGDDAGVAAYAFTPAESLTYAAGYRLVWTLTFEGGAVRTFENDAMVVRRRLSCPIADPDLIRVDSNLDKNGRDPLSKQISSWQSYIDEAFVQLQLRLIARGNRPHLIVSPSSLREVLVQLTLALIYEDFGKRQGVWAEQATKHRERFEATWKRLDFDYAPADGPLPTGPQRKRPASSVLFLGTRRGRG